MRGDITTLSNERRVVMVLGQGDLFKYSCAYIACTKAMRVWRTEPSLPL